MKMQLISIEGNIGVGKSTFTNILKSSINKSLLVPEPVDLWLNIKDENTNILQNFYQDIPRWAYTFQNMAYITRSMMIENVIKSNENSDIEYIFLDRSLGTDRNVFEKMLYDENKIDSIEHQCYNLWCDFYENYVRSNIKNKYIYLRCDPNICLERITKRGRSEESKIDLKYLENLHKYHESWLVDKDSVLVLDCNKDFETNIDYQKDLINMVKKFISD
jgi:deoxyadenosine/deoxycytidine kinase